MTKLRKSLSQMSRLIISIDKSYKAEKKYFDFNIELKCYQLF